MRVVAPGPAARRAAAVLRGSASPDLATVKSCLTGGLGGGGGGTGDRDGGQKETPAATSATSNTRPAPPATSRRGTGRGRAACPARFSESEGAWFTSARCASKRSRTSTAD